MEAALRDPDHVRGDPREQALRDREVHLEGPQVAGVDAEAVRLDREASLEFRFVVHLQQHRQPEVPRRVAQVP